MRLKKLKKAGAVFLSFAMILGMMPAVTKPMEVQAANTEPDTAYWTDVDGLKSYNMTTSDPKGKIRFGKNGEDVREWYIAGVDTMGTDSDATDDTLAFLSTSQFQTGIYGTDSKYSSTDNNFFKSDGYFATYLSKETNAYFSDAEIDRMKNMTVSTLEYDQKDEETPNPASGKLYLPDAKSRTSYGSSAIYVGTNNNIPINLEGLNVTTDNDLFWLRSPDDTGISGALVAYPGSLVYGNYVFDSNVSVVPAFNLNLSSVLFASAANAASSSYKGNQASSTMIANTYTLRYAPVDTSWDTISAEKNAAGTSVKAMNADGKYLMVQNSEGVYASAISGADATINASEITIGSTALENFNNCKVWVESTTDNITTAKLAVTQIETIEITGIDAPAAESALDTTAACETTGVKTTEPTISWTPNDDTAGYKKTYTASVTLEATAGYEFTDSVAVTSNEQTPTSVTKNANGTLTVSYAFPKTAAKELTNNYYATKDDLMDCFGLESSDKVGKVIFGQNGSGTAQEWKIAGTDTGVGGDNIVLFAATPLEENKVFNSSTGTKTYNSAWNCAYQTALSIVNSNHYGGSDLRQTLLGLETNENYFSTIEQAKMNDTTITTNDTYNGVAYTTTDKLYAAYGDYSDNQYITVGTNTATQLNSGLKIDINNWEMNLFWLRSPHGADDIDALVAYPGDGVFDYGVIIDTVSVVPAFNLNLSSVLFASAASAASSSYNGDKANSTMTANTYTLRYVAGASDDLNSANATISADKKKIKITGAASNMYLMVQNSAGAYAVDVSSNPLVSASDITIADTNLSTFDDCKVWLETTDATSRITTAKEATQGEENWYDVNITAGSNMTKTPESGAVSQSGITAGSAMADVVYTADEGYYFPDTYAVASQNGVTVTRNSDSQIMVSGTPTADVELTLTDATEKTVQNIISLTSRVDGVTDDTTVVLLQGGGTFDQGSSRTVTAPEKDGYEFKGWYPADTSEQGYTGNALSNSLSYTFTLQADTSLVAVYTANAKVKLSVTGLNFTVNGGANQTTGNYGELFKAGTKITLAATGENFAYWMNSSKKIVSTSATYEFTLVGNADYTPVYKTVETNSAFVEFVSDYGQIVQASVYTATQSFGLPDGPSKMGYKFTGWSKNVAEIQTAITEGTTYLKITPVYQALEEKYSVTVKYAGVDATQEDDVYEDLAAGSTKTLTAKEITGKKFSHWAGSVDGLGILGTSESYFIAITADVVVYAVYVDEAIEVKQKPVINITDIFTSVSGTKNKISFSATRDVPEGYIVQEQGMLYGTDTTFTDATMIIGNSNVRQHTDSLLTSKGVFVMNINVGTNKSTVVYARGYMILKNTSTGNEETYYSEIASGSFDIVNSKSE